MERRITRTGVALTIHYKLTEIEQSILGLIAKEGRINYRELKYGESNPKDDSGSFYFQDCKDLRSNEFIEEDSEQEYSFVLTEVGECFVKDNPLYSDKEATDEKRKKACCYKCGTEIEKEVTWGITYSYCHSCKEKRLPNGENHPFN